MTTLQPPLTGLESPSRTAALHLTPKLRQAMLDAFRERSPDDPIWRETGYWPSCSPRELYEELCSLEGVAATQPPLGPSFYITTTQKIVRKVRLTQRDRVLAQLRDGPTCGTEFLDMKIPRYGGRILELRQAGHTITNEECWKHQHYSRQTIYRLR